MNKLELPSIWIGAFDSHESYCAGHPHLAQLFNQIDDRLINSRHPFRINAYCEQCRRITLMEFSWTWSSVNNGAVSPSWTETPTCSGCKLNSRMRALFDYVSNQSQQAFKDVYIAEQTTPGFIAAKSLFSNVIGSEFVAANSRPGEQTELKIGNQLFKVRHEDLTQLSFEDSSFDLAISLDVFEHVPNYEKAFKEIARILRPGGLLAFTIPFHHQTQNTVIRAHVAPDGSIKHALPPIYHGDPVGTGGILCFQDFGWDILDTIRRAGFRDAKANCYWGPWKGHLGTGSFVLSATRLSHK